MRRVRHLSAVLVAVSFAVASCSSDDSKTQDAATTTASAETTASTETTASAETTASGETTASAETTAASSPVETNATEATSASPETSAVPNLPTQGVSDSEILVGGVVTASYSDFQDGAEARIKRTNDAGGVNGRKIVVKEWLDDGADQTVNSDDNKQLVERDGVFAAFEMSAAFSAGDYLAEQNVPHYGWSISTQWCTPMSFGFNGGTCPTAESKASPNVATSAERILPGGSAEGANVVLVGEDNELAKVAAEGFVDQWLAEGAKAQAFSKVPTPPNVVSDFSPYVLDVQDAHADVVLIVMSPGNTIGMISALKAAGFDGTIINFVTYDPRLVAVADGVNTLLNSQPYEVAPDNPAVQQMIDDVKAANPDVILSQSLAAGYNSADLMIATLEAAGPDLTTNSFIAATESFSYDFDGRSGPVSYPENHTLSNGCWAIVTGDGTGYKVGAPLACLELFPNKNYEG